MINGSPRKNGTTAFILDRIAKKLDVPGLTITRHCLGTKTINFCTGCRKCEETAQCIHNDDTAAIIEDIKKCDFFIAASPSYWGDITGQFKTFIDRNLHLCNTAPCYPVLPKGKTSASIAVRTGKNEEENIHIIKTLEHYFGHLGIEPVLSLSITKASSPDDIRNNPEALRKTDGFAEKLNRHLTTEKNSSTQI